MSQSVLPARRLCGDELKLLAIVAMTIDHVAWLAFPGYSTHPLALLMHAIGRLACPIMCYFISEGYHYTGNFKKYALRLLLLAAFSHFAYQFFSCGGSLDWRCYLPLSSGQILNQTSVIWALLGGLVMLRVNDLDCPALKKTGLILLLCLVTLPADWSCIAPLCILSIGANRGEPKKQISWCLFYVGLYVLVYCLSLNVWYGLLQLCVFLSVPLLQRYDGTRGKNPALSRVMKPLFYLYYPLHLIILTLLFQFL